MNAPLHPSVLKHEQRPGHAATSIAGDTTVRGYGCFSRPRETAPRPRLLPEFPRLHGLIAHPRIDRTR